jgi:hypothetical protein
MSGRVTRAASTSELAVACSLLARQESRMIASKSYNPFYPAGGFTRLIVDCDRDTSHSLPGAFLQLCLRGFGFINRQDHQDLLRNCHRIAMSIHELFRFWDSFTKFEKLEDLSVVYGLGERPKRQIVRYELPSIEFIPTLEDEMARSSVFTRTLGFIEGVFIKHGESRNCQLVNISFRCCSYRDTDD